MEYWTVLLLIVMGVLSINYLLRNFNFFKRHGMIHVPPIPIMGVFTSIIFRRASLGKFILNMYNFKPDAKYYGIYAMMEPVLFCRDPELVKETFVKNFEAFSGRRGFGDFNDPLLQKNLFSLNGQRWREVRSLLSPSFTSSKMKSMFTLMSECAIDFAKFLSTMPADKTDMDMKDAFSKYTNDVIATCAFGIKTDSMKDPTNKFYTNGKDVTDFSGLRTLRFMFCSTFPKLARILNIKFVRDHVSDFFKDIIKTTIATRDAENITRPDMLQLMMDTRDKHEKELDIDEMIAQAFIFFFGGFDTSSTTMCFTAHEIAANPDVQLKLRQEIDEVLKESNGGVTYEAINRLEYLDAVISEALRLYPPVAMIERTCEESYELPPTLPGEKSFTIKKGMRIWAPLYAFHHDKKYYDDPEKFRPERFLNDKRYHNSPYYMPFGTGPRMCIANRFAMLEVKVLLFHLLARCELKPCAKTTLPMKLNKSITMMAEGGFWLNVQRRNDTQPTIESTIVNNDNSHS